MKCKEDYITKSPDDSYYNFMKVRKKESFYLYAYILKILRVHSIRMALNSSPMTSLLAERNLIKVAN